MRTAVRRIGIGLYAIALSAMVLMATVPWVLSLDGSSGAGMAAYGLLMMSGMYGYPPALALLLCGIVLKRMARP